MGDDFPPPKIIAHAPPLSITIEWCGHVGWWLNIFEHLKGGWGEKGPHVISFLKKKKKPPMLYWVTEKIQLPFDGGGVLDGD